MDGIQGKWLKGMPSPELSDLLQLELKVQSFQYLWTKNSLFEHANTNPNSPIYAHDHFCILSLTEAFICSVHLVSLRGTEWSRQVKGTFLLHIPWGFTSLKMQRYYPFSGKSAILPVIVHPRLILLLFKAVKQLIIIDVKCRGPQSSETTRNSCRKI